MTTISAQTMAGLLSLAAERYRDAPALSIPRNGGREDISYADLVGGAARGGLGLMDLGLKPGDRAAILCDTRPEWTSAQLAITAAGGVIVPIYPSSSPDECRWVLHNSGCKLLVVENTSQLEKIAKVRGDLPCVQEVISIEPAKAALTWEAICRDGAPDELSAAAAQVQPADAFAIVYTSGTTGRPKGCVLSHRNFRATLDGLEQHEPLRQGETTYLFLPLAHVFSLVLQLLCLDVGGRLAFWGGDPARIIDELQDVEPAYFPSIPRIFEKIYGRVAPKLQAELGKRFDEIVALGCEVRAATYAGRDVTDERRQQWEAVDEQVFAKVRAVFGGKIREAATGAAPIDREVLEFFYAAGIPVLEGYGMTETATAITVSTPEHFKFGTVGRPLPHLEVRIASDGEILVKGDNVFEGYYQDEAATAEAIKDGWLYTGDLGAFDDDGFLTITGRKKDMIITSGGKNIAPTQIEDDVKRSPYVSHAVMHGDRRPYPVMLVTLDPEGIKAWAREHGKNDDPAALAEDRDVNALVQEAIDEANDRYAKAAQVKKFFILDHDLAQEAGELTPTMKVKRNVVNERYASEFHALYASG